jgi:hypothetical protein
MPATGNAMDPLKDIQPQWRTLVIAAVALAYPVGQTGFELGAYGELFFDNKLSGWITVTATLIVLAIVPRKKREGLNVRIWILAIPSVWMLFRLVVGLSSPNDLLHPALFVAGAVSFALCVPYAIYLIVRIANPDLPDLREPRLRVILAVLAISFFATGYGIGLRNDLFQTCEELQVYDEDLPAHCLNDIGATNSQGT